MVPPGATRLLEDVAGGRYEEALGVPYDPTRDAINRAHVRALARHREDGSLREALNRAKGVLAGETPLEKARRLVRIDRREEALVHLERELEARAGAEAHHLAGYVLAGLGREVEAREHLARAAALRGSALDEIWLGDACERLGDLEAALECYRRAIRARGHATEHALAGKVLDRLGRSAEALSHLDRALALGLRDAEVAERRRTLARRQRRSRLRGRVGRAAVCARREPLDLLLAGLALAYGIYFFVAYL